MGGKSAGGAAGGALSGAGMGTMVAPGIGTAIGAGAGALLGSAGGKKDGGGSEKAAKNIAEEQMRMQRSLLNPTLDTASMRTSLMSNLLGDIENYTRSGLRAQTDLIPGYQQLAQQQMGMQGLFNEQSKDFAYKSAPLRTLAFGELQSMLEGRGDTKFADTLRAASDRSGDLQRYYLASAGDQARAASGRSGDLARYYAASSGDYARQAYNPARQGIDLQAQQVQQQIQDTGIRGGGMRQLQAEAAMDRGRNVVGLEGQLAGQMAGNELQIGNIMAGREANIGQMMAQGELNIGQQLGQREMQIGQQDANRMNQALAAALGISTQGYNPGSTGAVSYPTFPTGPIDNILQGFNAAGAASGNPAGTMTQLAGMESGANAAKGGGLGQLAGLAMMKGMGGGGGGGGGFGKGGDNVQSGEIKQRIPAGSDLPMLR